jgi:hypothetical protein
MMRLWTIEAGGSAETFELADGDVAAVVEAGHTATADGGTLWVNWGDKYQALMDLARLHDQLVEKRDVYLIRYINDLYEAEPNALVGAGETGEITSAAKLQNYSQASWPRGRA